MEMLTVPVTTVSVSELTDQEDIQKAKELQDFYMLMLNIYRMVTNASCVEFRGVSITWQQPCHGFCSTNACDGCGTLPQEFRQALAMFNVLYNAGIIPSEMVTRCIEFVKTFETSEISTFEGARNCLYPKYYPKERCNIDVSTTAKEGKLLDFARIFYDYLEL